MKHLKLFFACLLMAVLSIGQMWAATADVTYDFTVSGWTVSSGTLSNGVVSFTGAGSANFKMNGAYFMMGKSGAYINFPTYAKAVEKIVVTGNSGASGSTKMNIYVGETAVSTETTGSTGTNTYNIASASQAAGTTYTLKVTSNHNAQITKIEIFYVAEGPVTPTCATPTFDPEDGETFTDNIEVEIASATDGATIYYTTDGEDPTTSSDVYTTALNFTETTTLKAMAVKEGSNNSAVATATYTKVVPFSGSILEIVKGDFTNTSYDDNAGDHEKGGITFTTAKVYQSGGGIQFQKTNGLLYNKTDLGEIAKIEITTVSGKSNNLVVYSGTTENPTSGAVTGSTSGSVTTYTFAAGKGFFAIKCNSTGASNVDPIKIYYVYSAPAVATPSISGATPFATTTTVTLGCTTDGASIYYTTDGSDPSSSSTLYEDPFELNTGATVKAIAIKGSDESSIASKVFEKVTSYSTLADIFTKATEVGSTATDIYVTFSGWKVSAKTSNNVFLTDGTNGAVIYGSGHGFNAGDVLTGTVACKVQLYKGFSELTSLNSTTTGLTVTPGSVGDPVVKTWDQLSAVNTGALVKLENLTYDGSILSDGVNTIPTYTTFYTATFEAGKSYNLTGVYQYYDTDGQILPRSAADVEEIIETFTVTYNNAPDNGTLTIKNGDEVVTTGASINEGTVLTIVTTPSEGYKLTEVTVNGSAYAESTLTLTENVTIAASFEEDTADPVNSYVLSVLGTETPQSVTGLKVGDKVTLPPTAATCSKTFVGWTTKADFTDGDEALASYYAAGAKYTLALDNTLYAVYATPDANADTELFATTSLGSTNTVTEGYAVSAVAGAKTGYYQDGGNEGDKRYVQVMTSNTETQIIPSQPSTITVTATIGGGSVNESLTNPVYAVLLNAAGEEIGTPVVMTSAIEDADGEEYSQNLPVANYADVRGVRIYHIKENKGTQGYNVRYYAISLSYTTNSYSDYSTDCAPVPATLESVAISGTASVLEYTAGDAFNPAGLVVNGHYSDNTDAVITEGINWAFNPATLSTTDESVSVTATVGEITSAAFVVNGLTVTAAPATTSNVVILATHSTKLYAMSTTNSSNAFAAIEVTEDGSNIVVPSEEAKAAIQWTRVSNGVTATFQDADSKYLTATNGSTNLNLGDAECAWKWYAGEGKNCYSIENEDETKLRSFLFYSSSNSFKNYALSNIGGNYSDVAEVRVIAAENIVVVAPTTHTLSYDANGGTLMEGKDDIADAQVAEGATVTVATNVYEKDGYVFAGWKHGDDVYNAGQTFDMPTEDVELVAQWTVKSTDNVVILAKCQGQWYAVQGVAGASYHTVAAVPVVYQDNVIYLVESKRASITWERTAAGNLASFKNGENYLSGKTSDSNDLDLSEDECWWTYTDQNIYQTHASHSILYSSQVGLFKNYKTSNKTDGESGNYSALPIVVPAVFGDPSYTTVREELAPNAYYTMCLGKAVDAVRGGSVWKIVSKAQGNLDIILEEVTETLQAGRPYIFYATANIFEVVYTGSAVLEPVNDDDNNGLIGSFSKALIANVNTNYIIYNNELYFVNSDNVYVGANRAYIDMTAVPDYSEPQQNSAPRRRVVMTVHGEQVATGFENLNASEKPVKLMIDGNIFILRGEKLYDATGRLVK